MRLILRVLICLLPWRLKRVVLVRWHGYELHPSAHIGIAYVFPDKLEMAEGSKIGHLTVALNLHEIVLARHASLARLNWITGCSMADRRHFLGQPGRIARLRLN